MPELLNGEEVRIAAYRRLLPVAVVAFLGSWVASVAFGLAVPMDVWLLPGVAALWLALWWTLGTKRLSLARIELILHVSLAAFFIVKVGHVSWFATDPEWWAFLKFTVYLPTMFALVYWAHPRERAWRISWVFLGVFLLVAGPFVIQNLTSGTVDGRATAVVVLHITIMSAMAIHFLRAYGETVSLQRRELTHATRLAHSDSLTQLENRRGLEEHLERSHRELEAFGTPYAFTLVDIDRFKPINDTLGHNAGDAILQGFAIMLRANVRSRDVVGRWGGEEFAIVSPRSHVGEAAELAERLRGIVRDAEFAHGARLTASFGVAQAQPNETIGETIGRADAALYRAKEEGRDLVRTARSPGPADCAEGAEAATTV